MATKKSELCSSLWRSCDELRGRMDASQYKDYVLGLLPLDRFPSRSISSEIAWVHLKVPGVSTSAPSEVGTWEEA